jgi:uncharacterized protein DUF669
MPEYTTGVQQVVPEGEYDFTVDEASEKESQKGNPMIELQLLVEHDGAKVRVFDNLVFVEAAFWKIDAFRFATGEKLVEGQKVSFEAEDCIGRCGRCHLYVDNYEGRTRNKVDSYLPPKEEAKNVSSEERDNINF